VTPLVEVLMPVDLALEVVAAHVEPIRAPCSPASPGPLRVRLRPVTPAARVENVFFREKR
jgi:hypothetical protein